MGTEFDERIPTYTRRAAAWAERNYSFLYMENFRQVAVAKDQAFVSLTAGTKRVLWARQIKEDGSFLNLDQFSPRDVDSKDPLDLGTPSHFWLDGDRASASQGQDTVPARMVFNIEADRTFTLELTESILTVWPTTLTKEPWLLKYAEDFMEYQTILQMAQGPELRDAELATLMRPLRDEALNTVLALDEEARRSSNAIQSSYGRDI